MHTSDILLVNVQIPLGGSPTSPRTLSGRVRSCPCPRTAEFGINLSYRVNWRRRASYRNVLESSIILDWRVRTRPDDPPNADAAISCYNWLQSRETEVPRSSYIVLGE